MHIYSVESSKKSSSIQRKQSDEWGWLEEQNTRSSSTHNEKPLIDFGQEPKNAREKPKTKEKTWEDEAWESLNN